MTDIATRQDYDFKLAVDQIPGLVWSAQPDGSVDFVNLRWREYTGLSLDEAKGWGWQATNHPDDLQSLLKIWRGLLAAGQAGETEGRLKRFDGTYRWFLFRAIPLQDDFGRVVKWYGQTTDIEDRKWVELRVASEKRLLEMIAKGLPLDQILAALCGGIEDLIRGSIASILLVDPEGHRLRHGASPSLPKGLAVEVLPINGEGSPCVRAAIHGETVTSSDLRRENLPSALVDFYQSRGLMTCTSTPIKTSAGKVLGTFALYWPQPAAPGTKQRDALEQFTYLASIAIERAQAEEALRRMQQELAHVTRVATVGTLTASIAHELNQPLTGIVMNGNACLRWLAAEPPNLREASEAAQRIILDGKRAGDVIAKLRAMFVKADSPNGNLDVNESIEEVLCLVHSEVQKHRVALRTELGSALPKVQGDRVQVQQVILNLVVNAIEAVTPVDDRPREVIVRTDLDKSGQVRVCVLDNGIGIEPDKFDRIFDAFYTSKRGGMGMGLAISKSIVENHGGRLSAKQREGPGVSFEFTLSGLRS